MPYFDPFQPTPSDWLIELLVSGTSVFSNPSSVRQRTFKNIMDVRNRVLLNAAEQVLGRKYSKDDSENFFIEYDVENKAEIIYYMGKCIGRVKLENDNIDDDFEYNCNFTFIPENLDISYPLPNKYFYRCRKNFTSQKGVRYSFTDKINQDEYFSLAEEEKRSFTLIHK